MKDNYNDHIKTVKKAIHGNEGAFETLLQQESKKLYYVAMSYMHHKEDALDAVQETACQAYLSIHQVKKPKYFSTWLVKILIRECYKLLKKKQRTVPFEEELIEEKFSKEFPVNTREVRLAEALGRLDHSQQTAILLFYYHDFPIKQIAEVMEKPEGTIKTYLHRGKLALKKQMERGDGGHEEWAR